MKSYSKQTTKWFLSTAMILALGSQYYFSVSSNKIYSADMASYAEDDIEAHNAKLEIDRQIGKGGNADAPAATRSAAAPASTAKPAATPAAGSTEPKMLVEKHGNVTLIISEAEKNKAVTDAKVFRLECADGCDKTQLSGTQATIETLLGALNAKPGNKAKTDIKLDVDEEDCTKEENVRDRKKCIAEAKAKKNADAFVTKVEDLKELCEDKVEKCESTRSRTCDEKAIKLSCMTTGFAKILKSTQFKGKNKLDISDVNQAYNDYIESDLAEVFTDMQSKEERLVTLLNTRPANVEEQRLIQQEILELRRDLTTQKSLSKGYLANLSKDIPSIYSSVSKKSIDLVKSALVTAATNANTNYKLADQARLAKKPAEAVNLFNQAEIGRLALADMDSYYKVDIRNSIGNNSDAMAHYTRKFLPDLELIKTNLSNLTGGFNKAIGDTSAATTLNKAAEATVVNNGRDSRSSNPTTTSTAADVGTQIKGLSATPTGTRLGNQLKQ